MQDDPRYAEGFWAAAEHEPLFPDADPIFAAGWHAYWRVRAIAATL